MAAILSQPQCINFLGNSVHWLAHPTVINLPADSFCFSRHFGGSIRMPTIRKKKLHTLPPFSIALRWRHNEHDSVSNHQPHDCLLNRLFGCRSKKTSKLRVTGLCVGNSPVAGEFPAQMASNAENVSIWWRHHGIGYDIAYTLGDCHACYCIITGDVETCRLDWL